MACAGLSDRGRRTTNEDRFHVDESARLLVVADGLGGREGGEVAARLATDVIAESMGRRSSIHDFWPYGYNRSLSLNGNRLRTAAYAAHMRVVEAALGTLELIGMGTTVVAAVQDSGRLSVAWAGDSRLYLLGQEGLRRLTEDDSWLEAAMRERSAPEVAALAAHPLREALTNFVGCVTGAQVHVVETAVRPGDVVALTTDGVHATLADRHLAHILAGRTAPGQTAAELVSAALGCGSQDNCTAVVAHC